MAKTQSVLIPLMLLAVESSGVVALRTMKLVSGDGDAIHEAQLMFSEKIDAALEAAASLMAGASANEIVHRYRQHVAVNAKRLGNATEIEKPQIGTFKRPT